MEPKTFYRYSLNNRFGLSYVSPFGESDFIVDWSREDAEKLDYKKEFPQKVKFTGDTFNQLLKLEKSAYRCEFTDITVERNCAGEWVPFFVGRISLNDGDWDLDRCNVVLKIEQVQGDQCYEDNKTTKRNLFDFVPLEDRKTVLILSPDIEIETVTYTNDVTGASPCTTTPFVWAGADPWEGNGWAAYYIKLVSESGGGTYHCYSETRWVRYKTTVACADPAPVGWILLTDTCPGGNKIYVKQPGLFNQTVEATTATGSDTTIIKFSYIGQVGGVSQFDNGMRLDAILQAFVNSVCPGKTVVSDFFQINPVTPSTTNYVTGATSKVLNIIVYQKSDVKRPRVTGNATIAEISYEDLLKALVIIFNVRWRMVGDTFHVEHISFFSKSAGFDLTLEKYKKNVAGLRRYSYETQNIPKREEFKFMEASPSGDFPGVPIIYGGACVTSTGRNIVKTNTADGITTDIEFCLNNPDAKSSVVDDKGLVFIATTEAAGVLYVITEPGILESERLNNSLAWAQLQRDYHRHYRPLKSGLMNNTPTTFFSVLPTKKGEPVTIPLCCGDTFNPDDLITAPLGAGTVSKATFNFKSSMLTLELLYDATAELIDNAAPVAVNDTVTYLTGETAAKIIDVLANDTDADNPIRTIEILIAPLHGTATVTGDLKVLYTPTLPISRPGIDNFTYRVLDDYGEPSNAALVTITFNA